MIFRQARPEERAFLFSEGYKEWPKNRTFEQYCADNGKEDAYGTRYAIDVSGEIVSSLILLNIKDVAGKKAYGIGSVLTSRSHTGKGYASELLQNVIGHSGKEASYIFLFSDIDPAFYTKFGFRTLPPHLQKKEKSVCMVLSDNDSWNALLSCSLDALPDYF